MNPQPQSNGASLILFLLLFGLFIWSIIWSYSDAEERGKSGCLVALLVALLSWPIGLIVWLVFRPSDKKRY
jgi:apolipoprotein N-acyltransferase